MRSWGWGPQDRISVLIRRGRDQCLPALSCEDMGRRRWLSANQEEGPHQTPDLSEFPASRTVRNKPLLLKPPGPWYFVLAVPKGQRLRRKSGRGPPTVHQSSSMFMWRRLLLSPVKCCRTWAVRTPLGTFPALRKLGELVSNVIHMGGGTMWGKLNNYETWVHLGKRNLRYR